MDPSADEPPALAPSQPAPVAALVAPVPQEAVPYLVYQKRPGAGYIKAGESERATGRITEWPDKAPKSVSVICYIHGTKHCKGAWPKRRAPDFAVLADWARAGPGLTRDEHMAMLPA